MSSTNPKKTHYDKITSLVIESIENGAGSFSMPWHRQAERPINAVTGKYYRGTNAFVLWILADGRSNSWATFRQWKSVEGKVKKGSTGAPVIFYLPKPLEDDDDDEKRKFIIRYSHVFNRDDVEGYTGDVPATEFESPDSLEHVEQFINATKADIRIGGQSAYYSPSMDYVQMPDKHLFFAGSPTQAWYSVLLHEIGHWSGHQTRLDRLSSSNNTKYGSDDYAREELVAELTATLLCSDLGIEVEPRQDHAQYIASWIKCLKEDNKAFTTACAKAEQAATYLHSFDSNNHASRHVQQTETALA